MLMVCLHHASLIAQDKITVREERSGRLSQFEAQILDWDRQRISYQVNSRNTSLPSSRVVSVVYARSPEQLTADEQFQNRQFNQAAPSYVTAIQAELRPWVQAEMQARVIQCADALDDQLGMLQGFVTLKQIAPQHRYMHLLPLVWQRTNSSAQVRQASEQWIDGADESQSLIACSWLLSSDLQRATAKLQELARSTDSSIAHLATAQLWRGSLIEATASDIQRWQAAIDRMPPKLQAGPRLLLAQAMIRTTDRNSEELDQLLVKFMQLPIHYPEQYQICGIALFEANRLMNQTNRTTEAAVVLAELKRDYGLSRAALSLESQIENIDQ